ncbi:DUF6146 family protein [Aquimarina agarilytica]|uniref:DUF6146 family protein n=1 Tax=Aquimarina agarilytica TaxID=1087449 RepID=UPI000492B3AB|nr:DUF6146 family protein [Aquimarina agarilytica]
MRSLFYYIILFLFLSACATKKERNFSTTEKEKAVRIANDSLEYELIVFDIGFNRFLNSQAQPRGYYGINYLENKNILFVTEYNIRASNPIQYSDIYGPQIDYQNHIHYGYEVNYLLFNYFLFFQKKYRQRL